MQNEKKTSFATQEEAKEYMYAQADDPCIDNYRFAYKDVPEAMQKYDEATQGGCCGFYDAQITVNGREAVIGCNYGH